MQPGSWLDWPPTFAATLAEVIDERIHCFVVGPVDDRPVVPFLPDEAGAIELAEMERERRIWDAERVGHRAGGHSVPARLNQQAEHGESVLLGESGER